MRFIFSPKKQANAYNMKSKIQMQKNRIEILFNINYRAYVLCFYWENIFG